MPELWMVRAWASCCSVIAAESVPGGTTWQSAAKVASNELPGRLLLPVAVLARWSVPLNDTGSDIVQDYWGQDWPVLVFRKEPVDGKVPTKDMFQPELTPRSMGVSEEKEVRAGKEVDARGAGGVGRRR